VIVGATVFAGVAAARPEASADRYIVVLKQAVNPSVVASLHTQRYGAQVEFVYGHALAGYSAVVPAHRLAALRADETSPTWRPTVR
jgi:subtilisin